MAAANTTQAGGSEPQSGAADPSILQEALSLIYVAGWVYTYWIRAAVIGPASRFLIVVLSVIELVSAALHVYPTPVQAASFAWRYGFAGSLFVVACTLSIHHRRLGARLRRHDVILSSIRVLVEEGVLDKCQDDLAIVRQAVQKILDALVFGLEYGRAKKNKPLINATVLMRWADTPFRILVQDSHETFDPHTLVIDRNNSVAGRVADDHSDDDLVIYVPSTWFFHGVRINLLKKFPDREYFRATKIIYGAFQSLGTANQSAVKSLICMRVPLSVGGVDAVLCVSARKVDAMGYLELSSIKVALGFVAQLLRAAPRALQEPPKQF
jgi:hypothetical protein